MMKNNNKISIWYSDDTVSINYSVLSAEKPDAQILEEVFAQWNSGSGRECKYFLSRKCRSLSVGDFVSVNDTWYRCDAVGWKKVSLARVNEWFNTFDRFMKAMNPEYSSTSEPDPLVRWTARRQASDALGLYL